jgi:hypothetical protein
MKFGYLRHSGNDNFVIPCDMIKEFDSMCEKVDKIGEYTDEWYDVIDEFENIYGKFRVEGDLYSMRIVMEKVR